MNFSILLENDNMQILSVERKNYWNSEGKTEKIFSVSSS